MSLKQIIKICVESSKFDERNRGLGDSYLHLVWTENGYTLDICKARGRRRLRLIDESVLRKVRTDGQLHFLDAIITGVLKLKRRQSDKIFEQLPSLQKLEHDVIVRPNSDIEVLK